MGNWSLSTLGGVRRFVIISRHERRGERLLRGRNRLNDDRPQIYQGQFQRDFDSRMAHRSVWSSSFARGFVFLGKGFK